MCVSNSPWHIRRLTYPSPELGLSRLREMKGLEAQFIGNAANLSIRVMPLHRCCRS
jgi:hypothetical protein